MLIYIKLAIRNVHKNIRSIIFNGIGITLTTVFVVFIFSFSRGIENQIVQRNIRFETGAVTIKFSKKISGWSHQQTGDSIYHKLTSWLKNNPDVINYRPRISLHNAMIYGRDHSQRINMEGLTNEEYPLLCEMLQITEHEDSWKDLPNGILISSEFAQEAGLTLLDECNIVIPSVDGSINMLEFVVAGVFQNTSQRDKGLIYASYKQATNLYYTNLPTRILVNLTDTDEAENVASDLKKAVTSPDIEIETYKDHIGLARSLSSINRNAMSGMAFFLLFISFVGIWAMKVEQISERRKEIGTLLTFGFSRLSIKKIFLIESVYISLIFLSAGLVIVATLAEIIHYNSGVYLGRLASFAFGSTIISPEFHASDILFCSIVVLSYPLLATWLSLQVTHRLPVIALLRISY